ncbi:RNA polymerase sigma factor [Dyella flagellata]|uniref:DNA-directed RNA polymerase sigma-70 factor n=1 Tax=Dyella flagellata TaxID=1867833 RepID=A0ABQ5XDH0_9GAMM|nr:RNA polymerase sigma factor [Dyella flagellata]GLQ89027.1 DNA-directed RNA polymerase sigma-70 factor [Dyella flagellata]
MTDTPALPSARRQLLERMLTEMRPRLHRYAARMTGSVVDGDDVVQETVVKALDSPPDIDDFSVLERWLVRVTHNTAIDFLRRRAREDARHADEEPDMIIDHSQRMDAFDAALVGFRVFVQLPPLQRSTVIFKDVLGYSLDEVATFTGSSVPAVKSALQRGRARLKELTHRPDETPEPVLDAHEHRLLLAYASRFNARDFDAVRDMLADEVKLNLVNRIQANGKAQVSNYFGHYSRHGGLQLGVGLVDGKPALLVFDAEDMDGAPLYFMVIEWSGHQVASIRDFRYTRYALDGAQVVVVERPGPVL